MHRLPPRSARLAAGALGLGLLLAPLRPPEGAPAWADAAPRTVELALEPGTVEGLSAGPVPLGEVLPRGTRPLSGLSRPRYARLPMAESEGLTVALDADPKSPRLWVDTTFDLQLDDEQGAYLTPEGAGWVLEQDLLAPYRDTPYAVVIPVRFAYAPGAAAEPLTLSVRVHRTGLAVLGGRLRRVALVDRNQDARFDDPQHDRLYVDLDGDGEIEVRGGASEEVRLGEPFRVGEEGWVARVPAPSGRRVDFEPVAPAPPPRPRAWPEEPVPPAPTPRTPPPEDFATLRARFVGERGRPTAERLGTVARLGDLGSAQALTFLQEVVATEEDPEVRAAAIRATGNPAYLGAGGAWLLGLARGARRQTAGAVAEALHRMGHPGRLDALLDYARVSDHHIVAGTFAWLAWTRAPEARAAILDTLRTHPAPIARYHAYMEGVRHLEGGPPVDAMLFAASDAYPLLRAEAVRDLFRIGHPEARKLALKLARERPVNTALGVSMARVLGALGDPEAIKAMLGFAEDGPVPPSVRREVVEQLRAVRHPESLAVLTRALVARSPTARAIAAEVLASVAERPVTEALLKQAKRERDPEVLALLYEALGDHRDPIAAEFLLKAAGQRSRAAEQASASRALARLGFDLPAVRAHFLQLLDSPDDTARILALDAAGASGDPTLVGRIRPSLDHPAWQVRLAAVQALARLRVLPCIPLLIERLKQEPSPRVREALADALHCTTCMQLYDDAEIWERWWREHGEAFQIPTDPPKPPERHVGGSQDGFFGIPVRSQHVVFVIDRSGSMTAPGGPPPEGGGPPPSRLEVAVGEVLRAVARLPDQARVNVLLFESSVTAFDDGLRALDRGTREDLERFLTTAPATGGTNLYDALERALLTPAVDTLFVLSDGNPGSGQYVTTEDILRATRRLNQTRRVAIHTVSIGIDSELLRRLAAEHGGHHARR